MAIQAPKQWDEAYVMQCLKDEIALADLYPDWQAQVYAIPDNIEKDANLCVTPRRSNAPRSPGVSRLTFSTKRSGPPPHWRRDWIAAGELGTKLGLNIYHDQEDGSVSVSAGNKRRNVTERYEDHPSSDAATWAAITRAAIQKLEAGKDN